MTFLEVFLSVTCLLLLSALAWAGVVLYRIGTTVLRVQDTLEESLETIDDRVDSIDKILDVPLFSDSPEIKRLRNDMLSCKDAILDIAYSLSDSMRQQESDTDVESE